MAASSSDTSFVPDFSEAEIQRYSRHILLPEIGGTGQAALRRARVLIVGAGGLGEFIFRGVASVDNRLVLAGAIPAALLALAADGILGAFEKLMAVKR